MANLVALTLPKVQATGKVYVCVKPRGSQYFVYDVNYTTGVIQEKTVLYNVQIGKTYMEALRS
jgi:hypothetical protein